MNEQAKLALEGAQLALAFMQAHWNNEKALASQYWNDASSDVQYLAAHTMSTWAQALVQEVTHGNEESFFQEFALRVQEKLS